MPTSRSLGGWLRLPSRVALILGLGTVAAPGLQADAPEQNNPTAFDNVLVRSEGGKIYLSEGGGKFQELQLRDTAEARFLKQLLDRNRTATAPGGLRLNPTILAGGGGTGFYWNPVSKTDTRDKTGGAGKEDARVKATTPEEAGSSRKPDPSESEKSR